MGVEAVGGFRGRCYCIFTRETCRESCDSCWRMCGWHTSSEWIIRLFAYSFIHTLYSHSAIHVHVRKQQEQLSATAGCEWTAAKSSRQKMSNTNRTERKLRRKRAKGNETEQKWTEQKRIKAETQKQSKPTNEARQGRRRDADDDVLTVTNCSRGSWLGDLLLPRLLGLCSWPENKKQKQRREEKWREEKKMNSASRQKSPCGLHCCGNGTTTALLTETETETSAASSMPASASALAVTYCSPHPASAPASPCPA